MQLRNKMELPRCSYFFELEAYLTSMGRIPCNNKIHIYNQTEGLTIIFSVVKHLNLPQENYVDYVMLV